MDSRNVSGPIRVLSVGHQSAGSDTGGSIDHDDRFVVDVVDTVDAGHRLLRHREFDCVVAARDIPDGTGIEFLRSVRENRSTLPCLLAVDASGDRALDDEIIEGALSAGVTDFVATKPDGSWSRMVTNRIANAVAASRAMSEAERQQRRLDQFVSGISHDLRNPLNVAKGRLDLERTERQSDHVDIATDAIDRSIDLLEDLVTLAKQGERPERLEPVELRTISERCWATAATGDATLVVETDQRINAHPSRLRQLLANLFTNAVTHGGEDVTITVGDVAPIYTATRADDSLASGFYVADDGPGIPEQHRDRVFEVGYTTDEDGTGYGLNIVREIATAHDWDIAVTESRGGGARFEITGVEPA